jgi:hypothetical protein
MEKIFEVRFVYSDKGNESNRLKSKVSIKGMSVFEVIGMADTAITELEALKNKMKKEDSK